MTPGVGSVAGFCGRIGPLAHPRRTLGLVTTLVAMALLSVCAPARGQSADPGDPWQAVRECESGGDYGLDSGNGYYGAYQFLPETWDEAADGAGRDRWVGRLPNEAPPRVQNAVAEWLRVNSGLHHWPVCGTLYGVVDSSDTTVRAMQFPVAAPSTFRDDWRDPRGNGSRFHEGNDISADKHSPLVAVTDGIIEHIDLEAGNAGNLLVLRDADGWRYTYIHINNDTPGTDDGTSPLEHVFAPGIEVGVAVTAGQVIAYVGDSGNAEDSVAHLHFEARRPDGLKINPFRSLTQASETHSVEIEYLCRSPRDISPAGDVRITDVPTPVAALPDAGFRFALDGIPTTGIVDLAITPDRDGVWFVDATGTVVGLGSADHHGDLDDAVGAEQASAIPWVLLNRTSLDEPDEPEIVAIEADPVGDGYWLVGSDGSIHPLGGAVSIGPAPVGPGTTIVDFASTPSGDGGYAVATDGAVIAVGAAAEAEPLDERSSFGAIEPVAIETTASGEGYWILDRAGRLVRFGDADFGGNGTGGPACAWEDLVAVDGLQSDSGAAGWWVIADDLQTWAFGDARLEPPLRPGS